jgi:cytosine/adenosine deaminase-related metal-dependent hydrolase
MLAKGCNVALGIDAGAFDEDDDAAREMRIAKLLQVGIGFDVKVDYGDVLKMALRAVSVRPQALSPHRGDALEKRRQ